MHQLPPHDHNSHARFAPRILEMFFVFLTNFPVIYRLNLSCANRIHIVEPQWNPTVEAQAIGRALRLGQERHVTVIRYIMEETVEQVCLVATPLPLRPNTQGHLLFPLSIARLKKES